MEVATATFERLIEEHGGPVHRVCRAILRDEHLGNDAAQETFVRLWRRLRRYGLPESVGGWIRRAAVSSALDVARRRDVRERTTRTLLDSATDATVESRERPETVAAGHELRQRLEAALERLPEGQRTVFLLRHDAGLSLREAAEMLGLALPTVKTQFARACVRLQSILSTFAEDEREEPRA